MPGRWRTQATRLQSVAVEVCWRPAEGDAAGDFHDVIDLKDGRVVLVLGDAPGSGPDAADLGEALRFEMRRALRRSEAVTDALRLVDRTLHRMEDLIATAVCAVLDPAAGHLEVSNAGHLPILLANGSHAGFLEARADPPLGTNAERTSFPYRLEHDASLFLFTDGLVERRDASLDDGLAALLDVGRSLTGGAAWASELAWRTTEVLGQPSDDATVMSVRLSPARPGPVPRPGSSLPVPVALRLYVDPRDLRSVHTQAMVRDLALRLSGMATVDVEVVDVNESGRAEADGVLAAPTLIRLLPTPQLRVIGSVRSPVELARALQLPYPEETQP